MTETYRNPRPARRLRAALAALTRAGPASALAQHDAPATVEVRLLSAALATEAVTAAVSACSERGFLVAASLVARDGHLMAFQRDPLAGPHTVDVSRGKAYASASLRVPSGELAGLPEAEGLRFARDAIIIKGGVPIDVGGIFYGAIGVSGATQDADEECARRGIAAIAETLEFGD